ncbi:hypothetical protein BH24BAC1_BH24BAC1_13840 [soil metagenome]
MTTEETKQFIQGYFQAIAADKSPATLDQFIYDVSLKEHIHVFEAGLPGYQIQPEDMIVEGDKVFCRGTVTGVHTGNLFGIPASGRKVEFPLFIVYQITDGKISNHWMQADTLLLMQQIGVVPETAEAAH